MPLYEYKCMACGCIYTRKRPVEQRNSYVPCENVECPGAIHCIRVPSKVSNPQGGDTPKFHRRNSERNSKVA